jgi:hypothetical protein
MQILLVICGEDLTDKMREVDIILYPKRGFPGLPNSLNCFLQLLQHVPTIWPSVHKTHFSDITPAFLLLKLIFSEKNY